jgi:hypothetical protein
MIKNLVLLPFIFFIIYLTCQRFVKNNIKVYEWHCKNIYPFNKKLTDIEQEYIKKCIEISYCEIFRPFYFYNDPFIKRLSYFTYSHKSENNNINSSRLAYGSVIYPNSVYIYAKEVLKERKIKCEIEPNNNYIFGGLGWDIQNGHFKIYFRFINHKNLSPEYKKLLPVNLKNIWDSGLLSITYDINGNIVEKKIYSYSKDEMVAELKSDKRHDVQKESRNENNKWETKLSNGGCKILKMYEKNGYKLDTITFKNKMNYTLYFPMIG